MKLPRLQLYNTKYELIYQAAKEKQKTGFDLITTGYFYNSEGDGTLYYRYLVEGVVCDLLESEVHELSAKTQEERKTWLIGILIKTVQWCNTNTSDLSY